MRREHPGPDALAGDTEAGGNNKSSEDENVTPFRDGGQDCAILITSDPCIWALQQAIGLGATLKIQHSSPPVLTLPREAPTGTAEKLDRLLGPMFRSLRPGDTITLFLVAALTLTVKEAAAALNLRPATVRGRLERTALGGIWIEGRGWRVSRKHLARIEPQVRQQ
jgi:hypothetical protein